MRFPKLLLALVVIGAVFFSTTFLPTSPGRSVANGGVADAHLQLADSLLQLMTFTEKLGQLQQLDGGISYNDLPRLITEGKVGSVLNEVNPERNAEYQRIAREKSRLGIPLLIGRDVVHGFRTIFPIPLGQSASWNTELVREGSRIAAEEANAAGVNWTFAPMIDVARDPRWGRVAESPGEDPFLTAEMGVAMIEGFQGEDMSAPGRIAACAKHFAAYGMAEGGRDYNSAIVGDRYLHEVYLRPFKAAVAAGAGSFMTSFNEINDVPASGNQYLLRDVLKQKWNYPGMVVSDWESITEMIAHGYSEDPKAAALAAMKAGVDMEMTSTSYNDHLGNLIEEGKVDSKLIDDAVKRILVLKSRLGLFQGARSRATRQLVPTQSRMQWAVQKQGTDYLETAKQAAIESVVLLKNENQTLPLSTTLKSVAVIGPLADAPHEQLGTWSFDSKKEDSQTPLTALRTALAGQATVNYASGLKISRTKTDEGFAEALAAARASEVVLFFAGEEAILSGEAHSRAHLNLPGAQEELLSQISALGKPVVLIIMAGRPLILTDLLPKVDALLYAWHPGTMAGPALSDLLLGKANPSGHLPITFPRAVGQIPVYHAHKNTGRPASADNWVPIDSIPVQAWQTSLGNTSHYLDEGFTPLLPFGYGLSYTDFSYGPLRLEKEAYGKEETITVSIDVTNTGKVNGKEVVQLYLRDHFASVTRPVRELKAFQKINLAAGERRTVSFELSPEELSFYRDDLTYGTETGEYTVWVGADAGVEKGVVFRTGE
ncbi:beta-glucosidase BglX [Neolewinella antarctica]|uniref:Beta-glucosidase n=1 Tax=Neolewinella antarctica TaxID=442734 RepID=A0ABX0X8Q1_9BACT|nr:beta-glucosidase BglX [Neolewinella antarctica]NJC25635.1 beta-glucosidase [Neolewinella antarctica]